MTIITNLPNAPMVVDPNEILPVVHPSAGGAKTTVKRLSEYVATNVVSPLESVAPTWTGETKAPVLADGRLAANVSTVGKTRTVSISLTIAATTKLGEGRWGFELPDSFDAVAAAGAIGIARAINGGAMTVGVAEIEAGKNAIHVSSAEGKWGAALPKAWAAGDTLDLSITYRIE